MRKIVTQLHKWKASKKNPARTKDLLSLHFKYKYSSFKELLVSNTELLKVLSEIEDKLEGRQAFGMTFVRNQSSRAIFHTLRMIKHLDDLANHRYSKLFEILNKIHVAIRGELEQKKESLPLESTLDYPQITKEMVDWVGGKNANLGEIRSRLKLPIPEGFAITTKAHFQFFEYNNLIDEIERKKIGIDPNDPETISLASQNIQQLIRSSSVPEELEKDILFAFDRMTLRIQNSRITNRPPKVALRSSAIGEDSDLSFAGQYLSILNVSSERLIKAYKQVVASLFSAKAISYRLNKGIRDEDIAMSVACLQMVEAVASGIVYTRHPLNPLDDHILISAIWGLGLYAVEGRITPDSYTVAKDGSYQVLVTAISHKPVQLINNPQGGTEEIPVPPEYQDIPCLSPDQIRVLAEFAFTLENHYNDPQDIEWALDKQGRILILQSRSLQVFFPESGQQSIPLIPNYPVLIEKGEIAFPGIGMGPAFQVNSEEDLQHFPEGAVLVAKHSSPAYVIVMKKAQAILTDVGSVTGHMASLAREFALPTILNTRVATSVIPNGTEISIDAYSGRVYQGRVDELLAFQKPNQFFMKDTPVYQFLRRVADLIIPLHLADPKSPNFTPENCQSLHDIVRFVHERSYVEMFQISDLVSGKEGFTYKLMAKIPLDLHVIDLGEGLILEKAQEVLKKISAENIVSVPFKALLRGMTHERFQQPQLRPVSLGGFFSVMREQMMAPPQAGSERFGEKSYAIISDKYLNFSSRVGYHYSILDSYCGPTESMNYITFSFKGGAADDTRRNRRVRTIALILQSLDFTVEVAGDRMDARFQKHECPLIEEKLDQVGRLLLYTRQMDMLMHSEASVEALAKNFLDGNYHYENI